MRPCQAPSTVVVVDVCNYKAWKSCLHVLLAQALFNSRHKLLQCSTFVSDLIVYVYSPLFGFW